MNAKRTVPAHVAELLDAEARRINSPAFIPGDPVQFPRRYSRLCDIEIAALLCSCIAWGRRPMIIRDCERMLAMMDSSPAAWIKDRAYESLDPAGNIHRTFFNRNLQHWCRALHHILTTDGTVAAWAVRQGIGDTPDAPWLLADALQRLIAHFSGGVPDARCLPVNCAATALKRLNMALRWLVRDDGIVDLGVWDFITPRNLSIPLDVHVADTSRQLGLVTRRSNDRRTVGELTATLATLRPHDPAWYDYALFGIGIGSEALKSGL